MSKPNEYKVIAYTPDGVEIFNSIRKAAEHFHLTVPSVTRYIYSGTECPLGVSFDYFGERPSERPHPGRGANKRKAVAVTLPTGRKEYFRSMVEACNSTGESLMTARRLTRSGAVSRNGYKYAFTEN